MKKLLFLLLYLIAVQSISAQQEIRLWKNNIIKYTYTTKDIDSITVVTNPVSLSDTGYVDLGLSVKWSTCNLGASSPEMFGNYYAWGETNTKSEYSWLTYQWAIDEANHLIKYCDGSNGYQGYYDGLTYLRPEDDVVAKEMGGFWRMPTSSEIKELLKCRWNWTSMNGVPGYEISSQYTGNSIFIPAAGFINGVIKNENSEGGYYWASNEGEILEFKNKNYQLYRIDRCFGLPIRPVYDDKHIPVNDNGAKTLTPPFVSLPNHISNNSMSAIVIASDSFTIDKKTINDFGIVYSMKSTPTVDSDTKITFGKYRRGVIPFTLNDLKDSCTYYYCPYVISGDTTLYGNIQSFTTHDEYVDLGLSVKWATCNLGAVSPEDIGNYYAWGETQKKENFSWDNYKFSLGSNSNLTKYCTTETDGYRYITDNKIVLDSEDDAAYVTLGAHWHTPSIEEMNELIKNCVWTNKVINGIAGFLITSKINNKSIFLPTTGYKYNLMTVNNSICYYMTNSIDGEKYHNESAIILSNNDFTNIGRACGFAVRPVYK